MTEKFIKYKYITAAGGKENGRNRSYRYFNYICGRPYPYCRAGSGSESLNIIKNVIYIVGVFIGSICLSVCHLRDDKSYYITRFSKSQHVF